MFVSLEQLFWGVTMPVKYVSKELILGKQKANISYIVRSYVNWNFDISYSHFMIE